MSGVADTVRRMRSSTLGRLLLVGVAGLIFYAGWSLVVRPYPDGSCDSPLAVAFSDPVEIPSERSATETRPDYGEILRRMEQGESVSEDDPRFEHEVTYTENLREIMDARAEQRAWEACREQLSTAGFWWRGLGPAAIAAAVGMIAIFVLRGGPKESDRP